MSNEKRKYELTGRMMRDVCHPKHRAHVGDSLEVRCLEDGYTFGISSSSWTEVVNGRIRKVTYVDFPDGYAEILSVKYWDIVNSEVLE